jgi:hypothetical protein
LRPRRPADRAAGHLGGGRGRHLGVAQAPEGDEAEGSGPLERVRADEAIDVEGGPFDQASREEAMARTLVAARRARPGVTFLVYVGNLHAARREVSWKKGFRWMAGRMADPANQRPT